MVAPVKKAAKKATAATKKAPPKAKPPVNEDREAEKLALIEKIVDLRDTDPPTPWAEVIEIAGVSSGKAMFLYEVGKVKPKDRIKFTDDDDLAEKVVEARANELSWGTIMARTGLSEGKVRAAFEAGGGGSARGSRVGRGGRHPSDQAIAKPAKKAAAPAKKAAKKSAGSAVSEANKDAAAKKAPASAVVKNLNDMTLEELSTRLTGKVITVGGKRITVKSVKSLDDGQMEFVDAKNGGVRTLAVKDITKAGR